MWLHLTPHLVHLTRGLHYLPHWILSLHLVRCFCERSLSKEIERKNTILTVLRPMRYGFFLKKLDGIILIHVLRPPQCIYFYFNMKELARSLAELSMGISPSLKNIRIFFLGSGSIIAQALSLSQDINYWALTLRHCETAFLLKMGMKKGRHWLKWNAHG